MDTQTPWEEALDLDDDDDEESATDLRPLKRQRDLQNTSSSTSAKTLSLPPPAFLHRCQSLLSQSSQSHHTPHATQTVLPSQVNPPPHSSSLARPIPGPAGTVQAAMLRRKNQMNENLVGFVGEEVVPTQEYIRRAFEDGDGAVDDDFSRDPWLCAVDFVRREGLVVDDDGAIGVPLSAIKTGALMDKVAQVVAIIKSCTPNGLGDMMVTLKDPTGIIDASIHRTVLTQEDCGKDLSVGSAIIVQKVSVFSPSRSRHYLNITRTNVVKVISKDGKALSQHTSTASTVKHAALGTFQTRPLEKSRTPQKQSFVSQGRTEGIMNSLRQNANMTASAQTIERIGEDTTRGSSHPSGAQRNQNAASAHKHLAAKQDAADPIQEFAAGTDHNDNEVATHGKRSSQDHAARGNMWDSQYNSGTTNLVDESVKQGNGDNGELKHRQPLSLRTPLPQWTDEQLEELFAFE